MNNRFFEKDKSLEPAVMNTAPGTEYFKINRLWQGIPSIERTRKGKLFVTFYSGGKGEGPDNYVAVIRSDDDGKTWSNPLLVIDPPGKVRAFDPCLWHDPQNRLWLFWAQSYEFYDGRVGVWASICSNSDGDHLRWSTPVRIANGIMLNKPTVLSTGEWLLPCAVWGYKNPDGIQVHSEYNFIPSEMFSNVICSTDNGNNFSLIGSADIPNRSFDEHMLVERKDNSIFMFARTREGIGRSISNDKGKTWATGKSQVFNGPDSRFFIRRLHSGNLLLVNHHNFTDRNNLAAMISEDDGATWKGSLLLDERNNVSYPDGVADENGKIYVIYDRGRYAEKELLLAIFTEEDVIARRCINKKSKLKISINEGTFC